jgi:hypothetical protein
MAQLQLEQDPFRAGRWTITSTDPRVLASVPDALVQSLGLGTDPLVAWGLHPDEQDGSRDAAYREELAEIGFGPLVQVVELPRPFRPNVVWVDRYHLLVAAAPATLGTRLLGLYVGSKGQLVVGVHDPSVSATVQQALVALPDQGTANWDSDHLVSQVRFLLRYAPSNPHAVELRAPQAFAQGAQTALLNLQQYVAAW